MKKVLILQANSSQAISIAKYLKKYSNYYIVGCVKKKRFFKNKFFDEIIRIEDYYQIDIHKYDYVLPTGAESTFNVSKKYNKLSYSNNLFFDIKNLIAFDKIQMLKLVSSLGIPVPKTYQKIDEIDCFPIFYKEKFEKGGGSRGLAYFLKDIPKEKEGLIYQEFIDTPYTYGVGFLAKKGKIISYFSHKEILSYPLLGGSAIIIEKFFDKRLLNYTQKIIEKLNYNGWGLAEFKYCKQRKDFVFMELNAKFWASIELALANNPLFLNLLLNVDYKPIKIQKMLFIDRLLNLNLKNIIKNIYLHRDAVFLKERNLFYLIIRKFIPNKLVKLIKERVI